MTTTYEMPTLDRAVAVLGLDLTLDWIHEGGVLVDDEERTDAQILAATVLDGFVGPDRLGRTLRLGEIQRAAYNVHGRRYGDTDHTIDRECRDCGKTTWVDTTQGVGPTTLDSLRGAVPEDLFYEDLCGWCGETVTA